MNTVHIPNLISLDWFFCPSKSKVIRGLGIKCINVATLRVDLLPLFFNTTHNDKLYLREHSAQCKLGRIQTNSWSSHLNMHQALIISD